MAVPRIPELFRPVLEAHQSGQELRVDSIINRVASARSLSESDLSEAQLSGDSVFAQRIGWARVALVQLGLLDRPSHGATVITDRGRDVAASAEKIDPPRTDWAEKRIARESVLAAMAEFDREGRDETLRRHGFRRAIDYFVLFDGREYDAKALYGVAHGVQYPEEEPIRDRRLQGGSGATQRLRDLGFEVVSRRSARFLRSA